MAVSGYDPTALRPKQQQFIQATPEDTYSSLAAILTC